ncbi:MAG: hypothetical protein OHK0039_20310 [Bacteroidia bacterium]
MVTIFAMLGLIVLSGQVLIRLVNRFAAPVQPPATRVAPPATSPAAVSPAQVAAITAAVATVTSGQAHITRIEKITR